MSITPVLSLKGIMIVVKFSTPPYVLVVARITHFTNS